jgi:hypothetical protein
MSLKLELFAVLLLVSLEPPTQAHDIYSHLRDRLGGSCCNEKDCRPAPYRMTATGGKFSSRERGSLCQTPRSSIGRCTVTLVKQTGGIGAGGPKTGRATGWTMQPTVRSYRQTRQRFLGQRSPFVNAASSLFPNAPCEIARRLSRACLWPTESAHEKGPRPVL